LRPYRFSTVFHVQYPEGVDPGDVVVASVTEFTDKTPGLAADAGIAFFAGGTVLFVDDGVPYANYGRPTSSRGRLNDPEAVDAAICAAPAP
jgi:hypothetical protein